MRTAVSFHPLFLIRACPSVGLFVASPQPQCRVCHIVATMWKPQHLVFRAFHCYPSRKKEKTHEVSRLIIFHQSPIFTRHPSPVTRHPSLVTRHLSLVTRHLSLVTHLLSLVTRHLSLVTCHTSSVPFHSSPVPCHSSDRTINQQPLTWQQNPKTERKLYQYPKNYSWHHE